MPDKKLLVSLTYLGRQFFLHLFKKYILRQKSPGMDKFLEYYRDDLIVPLTKDERDRHPDFTKCVVCSICDPACPVFAATDSRQFAGPMDIACCLSRDLTESGRWPDPFLSTLCGACDRACPEKVPVSEIIVYLRRKTRINQPENLPAFYGDAIGAMKRGTGVFGKAAKAVTAERASVLYWRGCREAVWETNTTKKLLDTLGVKFTTVDELCCGALPSDMGLDYEPSPAMDRIRNSGATTIVTGCPSCANALKSALPDITVKSAVELICEKGAPDSKPLAGKKIAFHDPCQTGRSPEVWDPPRNIIISMGGELMTLEREKGTAPCCGAGGGLIEVDPELARRVARIRIEEIIASGAEALVTTCELCARNLASAVIENEKLNVYNLVELYLGG